METSGGAAVPYSRRRASRNRKLKNSRPTLRENSGNVQPSVGRRNPYQVRETPSDRSRGNPDSTSSGRLTDDPRGRHGRSRANAATTTSAAAGKPSRSAGLLSRAGCSMTSASALWHTNTSPESCPWPSGVATLPGCCTPEDAGGLEKLEAGAQLSLAATGAGGSACEWCGGNAHSKKAESASSARSPRGRSNALSMVPTVANCAQLSNRGGARASHHMTAPRFGEEVVRPSASSSFSAQG